MVVHAIENAVAGVANKQLSQEIETNYTLARALSNTVDIADVGGGTGSLEGVGVVPSRASTLDYGNSDLDICDRVAAEIAYALPYGSGLHGLRAVAGKGWQFNAVNVWSTGSPFTIVNNNAQANTGASTYGDRPNQVGSPAIAGKGVHGFFNTAAYRAQPFGTIGNPIKLVRQARSERKFLTFSN